MKVKEIVDPLGEEVGRMMAVNKEKAELLNCYLASVISPKEKVVLFVRSSTMGSKRKMQVKIRK